LIAAPAVNEKQIEMLEKAGCEVLVAQEPYDMSLPELLPSCHGLCLGIVRITKDLLQKYPDLVVIARHGAVFLFGHLSLGFDLNFGV